MRAAEPPSSTSGTRLSATVVTVRAMAEVTIVDESTGGAAPSTWTLEFLEERITVRELIRRRVYQEVGEYHASGGEFRGLVRPTARERALNGSPVGHGRVDWEEQADLAEKAFTRNGLVILVGDRQLVELDEEVDLTVHTEVTFLRLVALVGG
ncbi:hypothetical protein G443_001482 [Actinoalloteichus cyanogriseus DSM 43889]|uniref:Uncharacterized protein n=2 Tax=Actinoalloteichus cyanogriseus TaxID=2893586 RepID=A0ABT1JFE3_ACTCY|nr:hypothetical protein [Actinoalloteichus caeruleus DSM 43889]